MRSRLLYAQGSLSFAFVLENSFAGCGIWGCHFSPVSLSRVSLHCHLPLSSMRSVVILNCIFTAWVLFSLDAFKIFFITRFELFDYDAPWRGFHRVYSHCCWLSFLGSTPNLGVTCLVLLQIPFLTPPPLLKTHPLFWTTASTCAGHLILSYNSFFFFRCFSAFHFE